MTLNLDVLAYEKSPLGMVCLRTHELESSPGTIITEIMLEHELLMSSLHTETERALSSLALARHRGTGLKVMIGGLGLGYTAQEALRSDAVAQVDVVEFLPPVVAWMRDNRVPLAEELNSEPRLHILQGDVYGMLAGPPDTLYDLILIDVDHSPEERLGEQSADFYSEAGLERARKHLAPGGVLGVWSYSESSPFVSALNAVFPRVDVEPVSFDNLLTEEHETNWLFLALEA